jgi:hypothetical protein
LGSCTSTSRMRNRLIKNRMIVRARFIISIGFP